MYGLRDVKIQEPTYLKFGAQELCESRGGRPGLPVLNGPYGLCGRKAKFVKRHSNNYTVCKRVREHISARKFCRLGQRKG